MTSIVEPILHPGFPTSASIALSDKKVFGEPVLMRNMMLMDFELFPSLRQERERERDHKSFVISMNFSRFREGARKFSCWSQVVHSKSFRNFQQLFSGNVGEEHVLQRRLDVAGWVMNRVSAAFTCCVRGR